MKKTLIFLMMLVFCASIAYGAGTCVELTDYEERGDNYRSLYFDCNGNATVAQFETDKFKGWHLFSAEAWPVSGGTAPDAADLTIKAVDQKNGLVLEDLLGGNGVGLIHATLAQRCAPKSTFTGLADYPLVKTSLKFDIANQATASADFVIRVTGVK